MNSPAIHSDNDSPRIFLAPSILSADFGRLTEEIHSVTEQGADWIHVDVMDGHFVPNITIGPRVVQAVREATHLPVDVHLMIERPDQYIEQFIEAGADIVSVHAEACTHLQRTLSLIRKQGARAGVALNPHTPESVLDYVWSDIDVVLAMTVNPGFGGQKLVPAVVEKVRRISRTIAELDLSVALEVDGGVNPRTVDALARAGANVLVAGSAIFGHPPYGHAIAAIRDRALDAIAGVQA